MTMNPVYFQSIWDLRSEERRRLIALWLKFLLVELDRDDFERSRLWGESVRLCPMKKAISATDFVAEAPKLFGRVLPSKLFWWLASEGLVFPDKVGKNVAFRVKAIRAFCDRYLASNEVAS